MNAAIYVRVSTEEQAKEGFSISAQKQRLISFCQSQDWDVYGIYVDDGWSAKDLERPELKRLILDVEKKDIDVVLVYRLDRLTRSVLDLYKLLETFEKNDVAFRSATEVYDTTTAIGRLFITLVAALAQWERENLGERVRFGMEQMTLEGKWRGGILPFGYKYENKQILEDPNESKTVNHIIDLCYIGLGATKVAKILNEEFDKHPTRSGKPWHKNVIQRIISNKAYLGVLQFNGIEIDGVFPVFVDKKKFLQIQKLRDARRPLHPRQIASDYIFSGLLKCNRCGSSFFARSFTRDTKKYGKKKYRYYRCNNKDSGACDMPDIAESLLEEFLLDYLSNMSDFESALSVSKKPKKETDNEREIRKINDELKKIKARRKKWQMAFANDAMSLDELRERTNEDRKYESELKEQLKQLGRTDQEQEMELSPKDVAKILKNFKANWTYLERLEKKSAAQILIKSLTIDTPHKRMPFKYGKKVDIIDIEFR